MNNSQGIVPTIDLATNNGAYPYPMYFGNGNGNDGFFGGEGALWLIVILALFGGFGGYGMGGFGGFGGFGGYDFPWLLTGQQGINNNTNQGFDTLHLSNQIEGVRDGVYGISNQLCNSTASVVQAVNNGFATAEVSDNARQIANMQQAFNSQLSTLNGFNQISSDLASCCCENRLGVQDLKATVISENCSDREVLRQIGQDILVNQTANTQKIIDEIFRDRLDEKQDKIEELNRQLLMKDLAAGLSNQTQAITSNVYNELKNCPVGTVPVYGNQAIFSCPNNLNGCGCNANYANQLF